MWSKLAGGLLATAVVFLAAVPAGNAAGVGTKTLPGFWGEPFPYGYRWSLVRACQRRVEVETPRGLRWRTVWVCNTHR